MSKESVVFLLAFDFDAVCNASVFRRGPLCLIADESDRSIISTSAFCRIGRVRQASQQEALLGLISVQDEHVHVFVDMVSRLSYLNRVLP